MQVTIPAEPPPSSAPAANPYAEDPPWAAVDFLAAVFVFVATVLFSTTIFLAVSVRISGVSMEELQRNPHPLLVVSAMVLGYIAMLATMYVRLTSSRGLQFWQAIGWKWPRGNWWLVCFAVGAALAVGLGLAARLLPIPKSLPMDRYFHDRQAAYLMLLMGVGVAPLSEEIAFRGFLYPLLDRWLQTLFTARRQLLKATNWLLLAGAWGYTVHTLSTWHQWQRGVADAISLLAAIFGLLIAFFFFLIQWLRGKPVDSVLLFGFGLCAWGLLSRSISQLPFLVVTSAYVAVALVLLAIAAMGALSVATASRLGRVLAVLATSAAFASVHEAQLAGAWGPLLVIFTVGMALSITRALTRSVAPGFLIHMSYNFSLLGTVYFATDHFRHLERLTR